MSLYVPCVLQRQKMLGNLLAWLDQATAYAAERKFDPELLLSMRLSPDQFPLTRQIQSACDTAKLTASRVTGKEAPSHPDTETTIAQLRDRIGATIAYLGTFSDSDFEGAEARIVGLSFMPGKGATGSEYFHSFATPNFFFHLNMAYAILRHAGVKLGKLTYIGSMEMVDL